MQLITATIGLSPSPQLSKLAEREGWSRMHRGVYANESQAPTVGRLEFDHAARILAAAPSFDGAVVSHMSAAIWHGLPLLRHRIPERVHVTRRSNPKPTQWLHSHRGALNDGDVVTVHGVRCTSILRTLRDLADYLAPHELLAAADATAAQIGSLEGVDKALRNRNRMRWLLEHANGRAESFAESWSRYLLINADLELPILQPDVYDSNGKWLARPDFVTRSGLIGEFDGRVKYQGVLSDGLDAGEAVMREKQRENRLREAGHEIVRWDWDVLREPYEFIRRWQRAESRAARLVAPRTRLQIAPLRPRTGPDWPSHFTWQRI